MPVNPASRRNQDSPLFAHNNGQWAKKVRKRIHFFGVWADHQKALERWLDQKDDLLASRVPRCRAGVASDAPTLRNLVDKFLTSKTLLLSAEDRARCKIFQKSTDTPLPEPAADAKGELSIHTWNGYREVCKELVATFGEESLLSDLLPDDFERLRAKWAAKWGPGQ